MPKAWELPPLLPVTFPSPLMRTLAPGWHRRRPQTPAQAGTAPHQHLARAHPQPRRLSSWALCGGPGSRKTFLASSDAQRQGEKEPQPPAPAPPPASCPAQAPGMPRNLSGAPPRPPAATPLTWRAPAVPALLVSTRAASTAGSPFWVLGGYFPSGPTSLPVKKSEVGAGPPPYPPPPRFLLSPPGAPRPAG